MYRRNQLLGIAAGAFGLGLLIGCGLESGFWCCVFGIGLLIFGFACNHKK